MCVIITLSKITPFIYWMENFNFPLKSVYNDLWIKELKARTYAEDLMFSKANDLSWPQCVTV
jgi:hypothetical protein